MNFSNFDDHKSNLETFDLLAGHLCPQAMHNFPLWLSYRQKTTRNLFQSTIRHTAKQDQCSMIND